MISKRSISESDSSMLRRSASAASREKEVRLPLPTNASAPTPSASSTASIAPLSPHSRIALTLSHRGSSHPSRPCALHAQSSSSGTLLQDRRRLPRR